MFVTRLSRLARRRARPSFAPSTNGNDRGTRALFFLEALEARALMSIAAAGSGTSSYYLQRTNEGASPFGTSGPNGYSPAQVSHAYGFDQVNFANNPPLGTGTTIAIVDAYDDPNIANDLHQFDLAYGLPDPPNFTKMNQTGGTTSFPAANAGWITEIALDVEWAHAIAPGANILLVEANSDYDSDLYAAVDTARRASGVVAVSMSWGDYETPDEGSLDSHFTTPAGHAGVTFVASSGDSGAPASYPSASVNVVSVGGTTLHLNQGNYGSESGWTGSGGGVSAYETQPAYQENVVTQSTTNRGTPDVAYDSDPYTGFPVYDSYNNGASTPWGEWGGTSDAAPQWAALIAIADQGRLQAGLGTLDGPSQALPLLYGLPPSDFHDITTGFSLGSPALFAGAGYDLVTGRGTPYANLVVDGLIGPAPTVVTPASASPTSPIAGTTTTLGVLGGDANYPESALTYTWTATAAPPGVTPPTFSVNGDNASKQSTATFYGAGSYTFLVTIADPSSLAITSSVSVTVIQTLTSIALTPAGATVADGATQSFAAIAGDQFGQPLATPPTFTWSVDAGGVGGSIAPTGVYTAPATGAGTDTVRAASGGVSGTASLIVTAASTAALAIDAGGPGSGPFVADADVTGGATYVGSDPIDATGVADPAPQAVYQSERYGNFTYTLPGLAPGAAYTVRLHYAEIFFDGPGQRVFDVAINGVAAQTDFDIFAAAGGKDRAVVVPFTVDADAGGRITIAFTSVVNNAKLSGLEVLPAGSASTTAATSTTANSVAGTTAEVGVPDTDPSFDGSSQAVARVAQAVPSGPAWLARPQGDRRQRYSIWFSSRD